MASTSDLFGGFQWSEKQIQIAAVVLEPFFKKRQCVLAKEKGRTGKEPSFPTAIGPSGLQWLTTKHAMEAHRLI